MRTLLLQTSYAHTTSSTPAVNPEQGGKVEGQALAPAQKVAT
jgi:hypothetical protein